MCVCVCVCGFLCVCGGVCVYTMGRCVCHHSQTTTLLGYSSRIWKHKNVRSHPALCRPLSVPWKLLWKFVVISTWFLEGLLCCYVLVVKIMVSRMSFGYLCCFEFSDRKLLWTPSSFESWLFLCNLTELHPIGVTDWTDLTDSLVRFSFPDVSLVA